MRYKTVAFNIVFSIFISLTISACSSSDSGGSNNNQKPPPAAPDNVAAKATTEGAIIISWDDVAGAESYNLYMANENGVTKSGLSRADGTTPLIGFMAHFIAANPFTHFQLRNNQPYFFAVEAVYSDGTTSNLSTETPATFVISKPKAPGNLTAKVASSTNIPLSWDDNSNNELGFRLERRKALADGSLTPWEILTADISTNTTNFNDKNTTIAESFNPGATYHYRVFAFNTYGDSLSSNIIMVNTPPKDPNKFLTFLNTSAPKFVETDRTSTAYYAAIDPNNKKTTLANWKAENGFGTGTNPQADLPAVYLNNADLGFGRRMYMITHADGRVASYVENYANLDDALNPTGTNLLATVAMEFAPPTYKTPTDEALATSQQIVLAENLRKPLPNARQVYNLPYSATPTNFIVYAGRDNKESLGLFTLVITTTIKDAQNILVSRTTVTHQGEWLYPAVSDRNIIDPGNPSFRLTVDNSATTNAMTTVTIDISSDHGAQIELYEENGTQVFASRLTTANIDIDLPPGTYTAVAATKRPESTGNFELIIKTGANPPVTKQDNWVSSGGATPNSNANVFFPFTVAPANQTQRVTLSLSATEPTSITPVLYLLGAIGDYRYVEAVSDEMVDAVNTPSYASITKTLNAGKYWLTADLINTIAPGYTGEYSLEVINNNDASSLYFGTGSWTNSITEGPYPPNTHQAQFEVLSPSTSVTINLKHLDNTIIGLPNVTVYLLDSTNTKLLALNEGIYNNKSYLELDLLPGNYQVVATTDSRNEAEKFQLDITVNNDAPQQYTGYWRNSEEENPFSPNNPRFDLNLTETSRIKVKLSSTLDTYLYVIGRGNRKFTKFYTFGPDGNRVGKIDLDGQGEKQQPGVCHVCHGGEPKALTAGVYPDYGNTEASFMAWDPDLYKYSDQSPYTRADQEEKFMAFNQTVLTLRNTPDIDNAKSARTELIEGWYANSSSSTVNYNGDFIPHGWLPESAGGFSGVPNGADTLYLEVIKPTCRLCHLQMGKSGEQPINFGSYQHFMAFQKEIEAAVYDAGTMPLALRTFNQFWQTGQGDILANHLPEFSHYKSNSTTILKPGRPIANAGATPRVGNRKVNYVPTNSSPTPIALNGSASVFAANYRWELDQTTNPPPAGSSNIMLKGANTVNPTFIPDAAGDYTFILTVDDGARNATTSTSKITLTAVENLPWISFSTNIVPKLNPLSGGFITNGAPLGECTICHGIFFDTRGKYGDFSKNRFLLKGVLDVTAPDLHTQLLNKVNLNDPTHSKIIAYPSSLKHGSAGMIPGYGPSIDSTIPSDFKLYDMMEQWILEGAKNN